MTGRLSAIRNVAPQLLTSAELVLETPGEGFTDITPETTRFVEQSLSLIHISEPTRPY